MLTPSNVSEAHQRALLLERQLQRCSTTSACFRLTQPITPTLGLPTTPPASRPVDPSRATTAPRCFTCGEPGHRQANCPKSAAPRSFLADNNAAPSFDKAPRYDEDFSKKIPEEHLLGDTGPALVLRRTILAPVVESDDPQCTHIFQSTCTINSKVCTFIIDSGACENVVACTAVQKLSLLCEAHPKPYSLACLQRGHSVTVDRRVLITFSIGHKYFDSVWCDVVPMDVCHILVGTTMAV